LKVSTGKSCWSRVGGGGELTDEEVAYIQAALLTDDALSLKWGFRPSQKTRPVEAIRRVAMFGDPDNRRANMVLARPASRRPLPGPKSQTSSTKLPSGKGN
jgi:hypothetical protein